LRKRARFLSLGRRGITQRFRKACRSMKVLNEKGHFSRYRNKNGPPARKKSKLYLCLKSLISESWNHIFFCAECKLRRLFLRDLKNRPRILSVNELLAAAWAGRAIRPAAFAPAPRGAQSGVVFAAGRPSSASRAAPHPPADSSCLALRKKKIIALHSRPKNPEIARDSSARFRCTRAVVALTRPGRACVRAAARSAGSYATKRPSSDHRKRALERKARG